MTEALANEDMWKINHAEWVLSCKFVVVKHLQTSESTMLIFSKSMQRGSRVENTCKCALTAVARDWLSLVSFFLRIDHVQLPGELDLKNLDGRSALGRPLFWLIPMISNSCVARANLDGRSALGRPLFWLIPMISNSCVARSNLDGRSALGRPLFWLIPMISNSCVARATEEEDFSAELLLEPLILLSSGWSLPEDDDDEEG